MKTREPMKDTVVPQDGTTDPGRARFAASLFDELAAPPTPETWASGSFESDDEWLADADAQAAAQARAELAQLGTRVGSLVGPYRLTSLLGRGGMGAVFAAERADGSFAQRVALKLIIGGGARLASRFRRERAILARLDHPHIARLLDGGLSSDGEPWFAMELVDGVTLTGYCDAQAVGVRARVELFLQICDAVAFAHRHLIVHRDLKPPNVLVGADGNAKLLDFGIAKLVDRSRMETELTNADERVLTPDYAAPEQILGQPITTATDVYALGLVLYEMLTGERAQRLGGMSALEAERWVVNREIGRPSDVACAHARALRGDLDAIVAKALRKEPEHRYASAQALGEDLRRHLDAHAVQARSGTWSYRAGKFARRNRLALGASAAVVAALLLGLVGALWQAREAQRQAERAHTVREFVTDLFRAVDPMESRGGPLTAQALLDRGVERLGTQLVDQPHDRAEILLTLADMHAAIGVNDRSLELSEEALALARELYDDARLIPALSRVIRARGVDRSPEALALLDEAERLFAQADTTYDPERLAVLQNLVLRANRAGDFRASEKAAKDILALQERRFGKDSPPIGVGLMALGWAYSWQNRYDEAAAIYRRALEIARSDPESTARDRRIGWVHVHLGNLESHRGRYDDAEREYESALELGLRLFGPTHPQTAMVQQSIALNDFNRGRAAEAEKTLRAMRASSHDTSPAPEHQFADWAFGRVLAGRGKLTEAVATLQTGYDATRGTHGADAKLTQFLARDLGAALVESGEHARGGAVLASAAATLERIETTSSYHYALVESRQARLLIAEGDAQAAADHAAHAHAVLLERIGAHYDETARARHELGRALVALGRRDEGVAHLRAALASYEKRFGATDVRTAEYRFVLGEALQESAPAEARELLDSAAQALVAVDGNVLPVRARAERWLANGSTGSPP